MESAPIDGGGINGCCFEMDMVKGKASSAWLHLERCEGELWSSRINVKEAMISMYKTLANRGVVITLLLVGLVLQSGCTSTPEPLREGPKQSPDPAQVRAAPEQYAGMTVRWGGVIVAVENGATQSVVQVVSRPLSSSARPQETDQTSGRFLVRISGFVDPVDYAAGREFTVTGVLEGMEQRNIGDYRYTFPVVRASGYHLWPLRPPPMPDPYYYSPFYNPWYPYGPYPYYP